MFNTNYNDVLLVYGLLDHFQITQTILLPDRVDVPQVVVNNLIIIDDSLLTGYVSPTPVDAYKLIDPVDHARQLKQLWLERHTLATTGCFYRGEIEITPSLTMSPQVAAAHLSNLVEVQVEATQNLTTTTPALETRLVKDITDYELIDLVQEENDKDGFFYKIMAHRVLQHSTPIQKMHYPEPFLASPSMIHEDIWFMHILQFQYWLWFVFITLIMFFFITFLCVSRWGNQRTKPRRETRGVSRSKCGDFITATVPLTWALSIIVSESTDPTDYYDGFGTAEITIGIRAYQWGWEYYYPKNIDLMYNVRPNYASFVGNSLKHNKAPDGTTGSNSLWKFYQNNLNESTISPAHLLTLPNDNAKVLNHLNFNDIGADTLKESQAFKKIRQSSKTFTTNLVLTPGTFVGKYNSIYDLYLRDNTTSGSGTYGNLRQHNLTATAASISATKVSLDSHSAAKFVNQTLGQENLGNFAEGGTMNTQTAWTSNVVSKPRVAQVVTLNKHTDRLVTTPTPVTGLGSSLTPTNTTSYTGFLTQSNLVSPTLTTESFTNEAGLTQILPNKQTSRQGVPFTPSVNEPSFNPNPKTLTSLSSTVTSGFTNSLLVTNLTGNVEMSTVPRVLSNRLNVTFKTAPAISNNPLAPTVNFDEGLTKQTSTLFSGRNAFVKLNSQIDVEQGTQPSALHLGSEVTAIPSLRSPYWSMFWGRSNPDLRIYASLDAANLKRFFYLQEPTDYIDYDFRNAQAADLLEEALWESSYSAYSHQEYVDVATNSKKTAYAPKVTQQPIVYFYPNQTRLNIVTEPSLESHIKDVSNIGTAYANNIFAEDHILPASNLSASNYSLFTGLQGDESIEGSVESEKGISALVTTNLGSNLYATNLHPKASPTIDRLNAFRADFEEYDWLADDYMSGDTDTPYVDVLAQVPAPTSTQLTNLELVNGLNTTLDLSSPDTSSHTSSNLVLRSSARNSILSYNALQKVFRSRFEEGRSNVGTLNYSESGVRKPILAAPRLNVESLLGKNFLSYSNPLLYRTTRLGLFNELYNFNTTLNFQTFDFPFLLAETSDPAKFIWLDWRAKWGRKEVQPALTARLSLLAAPHTKKHFDYNIDDLEELQRWDFYSLRIARARKNYLTNWAGSSQPFMKNHVWFKQDKVLQQFAKGVRVEYQSTKATWSLMRLMQRFYLTPALYSTAVNHFTPSSSGVTSFTHTENSYPTNPISSYAVNTANLVDYLTKREYMYRQLLVANGSVGRVPKSLSASPSNPLVHTFKSSYNFTDPVHFTNESLRTSLSLKQADAHISRFLTNGESTKTSQYLVKSQYKPLKKGISNMLRLHSTGTIAMPIEMRLQILASSRDIIHSWSIPGAGIKIDCVPGYTSHRTTIFLVSGIYWGQCMEICGRYHHWMPIVVQFMKRDLFFLWCTHFISQPNHSTGWLINDRQHVNFVSNVSFDETNWSLDS